MIEVNIDKKSLGRIQTVLKQIDPKNQDGLIKRGVTAASIFVLDVLLTNVTGVILKVRTGNLARSFGMRVEKQNDQWVGLVGSGAIVVNPQIAAGGINVRANKGMRMVYANILETGGTIKPKGGRKFLTIPLAGAKTAAGVARFTALQAKAGLGGGYGGIARDGTFIKFPIIYGKNGKKITPLFKLVRSVTIPAKLYMSDTALSASSRVGEIMATEIEKGLPHENK